jgi:hypothetical protein
LRLSLRLSATLLAALLSILAVGVARAAQALHPNDPAKLRTMRTFVDHYRHLTWTYERAAHGTVTPTSYSYRRTADGAYLQWTLAAWQRHAYRAHLLALADLRRRLSLRLPAGPALHASLGRRIAYERMLALRLRRIYPGGASRSLQGAGGRRQLFLWQQRAADATLAVSLHATRLMVIGPRWLTGAFMCIHRYEGAWNAHTGNGYYGGLQMDIAFMRRYGSDFVRRWGTADNWPAWAQLQASVRAYRSGRGFWPWPNTAQACGLL